MTQWNRELYLCNCEKGLATKESLDRAFESKPLSILAAGLTAGLVAVWQWHSACRSLRTALHLLPCKYSSKHWLTPPLRWLHPHYTPCFRMLATTWPHHVSAVCFPNSGLSTSKHLPQELLEAFKQHISRFHVAWRNVKWLLLTPATCMGRFSLLWHPKAHRLDLSELLPPVSSEPREPCTSTSHNPSTHSSSYYNALPRPCFPCPRLHWGLNTVVRFGL